MLEFDPFAASVRMVRAENAGIDTVQKIVEAKAAWAKKEKPFFGIAFMKYPYSLPFIARTEKSVMRGVFCLPLIIVANGENEIRVVAKSGDTGPHIIRISDWIKA